MKKKLALVIFLFTAGISFSAIPFPLADYGHYNFSSELRNRKDEIVARERGTLVVSHFRKEGTKIVIKENSAVTTILFDRNHRYMLTKIANRILEQKLVGRWYHHVAIKTVSKISSSQNKFYSDFGLASNNIVFTLEPEVGFRQKFVAHKR